MPALADFSKLSNTVKNNVVKKTVYDKLVAKVNSMNTSGFVLKTNYDRDKSEREIKIPDTSGPFKKADYNTKITQTEGKIPSISGLATTAALITVENKIPNIISLVKRNLLIIIMKNILLLQSLIHWLLVFFMQDQHKQI